MAGKPITDTKIIHATIYFKQIDSNFKKVYDALAIIESKYKDAIEIKIKLLKIGKEEKDDLHVVFHNRAIYKDCHKLDTYIYIVDKILNKR